MRLLALTLGTSLMVFGCSNNPGGNGGNGGTGGSGGGVGGVGGSGGSGGGGGTGGSNDMATGPTVDMAIGPDMAVKLDRDPTAHPAPIHLSGPVDTTATIQAPEVYTIVWVDPANAGDDKMMGDQLNTFFDWMLNSSYFTTWAAEYGSMKGTAKGVLVIPAAPPATLSEATIAKASDYVTLLDKYIGTTGWPAASAITKNTMFVFFIDPKTVATAGNGQSCTAFGGYHIAGQLKGGTTVPYAVVARCPAIAKGPTEWQQDTIAASHELAEAVADPGAMGTNTADRNVVLGGGEIGDICIEENVTLMNGTTPYLVQRLWSEKAWAAGNVNPCLPADGPWFGAGVVGDGTGSAPYDVALHVDSAGNGSADFTIQPFSYDPTITSVQFEVVSSILPMGITLTPNIARTATTGMWGMGAPGTTFKVHVDAKGYMFPKSIFGTTNPSTSSLIVFAVSGTGATRRISNWWGSLTVSNP